MARHWALVVWLLFSFLNKYICFYILSICISSIWVSVCFMPKIDQNIGNFSYLYKTSNISKSLHIRFLKLEMSVRPEIWTSYSLYMPLKRYRGDFENFYFSAWFADFYIKISKILASENVFWDIKSFIKIREIPLFWSIFGIKWSKKCWRGTFLNFFLL